MKKKLLVTLAGLALAANAAAIERSHDGTGQAILLPYWHAADGETTLFAVTNHADRAKAVRVVVAEGRNGRAALTFNVYLAARDSWQAAIVPGSGNQPPRIVSNDESCTVPLITATNATLRTPGFTGSRADGLGTDVERLQHGSIEIVEMGVPTGVPADLIAARQCNPLLQRFVAGPWNSAPNQDLDAPAGGLSAEAQIVDVAGGVAFDVAPVTLDDFSAAPRHGNAGQDFNDARFSKPTVSAAAGEFVVGGGARVTADRAADAVSLLLMSSALEGGFLLGAGLGAETRFVLAFPTRAAYLDNLPGGDVPVGNPARAPFADATTNAPYCIDTSWQAIDRRGNAGAARTLPMCGQVNVVELGENDHHGDFATGTDAGRIRVDLSKAGRALPFAVIEGDDAVTVAARGLPAVAVSLSEVRNANAQPGRLASYAISHRIVRERDQDRGF